MKNYYHCKFEREAKRHPTDWVVVPESLLSPWCKLAYVGPPERAEVVDTGTTIEELRELGYGLMP
jgi:hypothetical protein